MVRKTDGERWRLGALVVAVAGAGLLVGPSSGLDGFSTRKLLAIGVAVAMLLVAGGFGVTDRARLSFPRLVPMAAALAFCVVGVVVALLSPSPRQAVAGAFTRWNGVGLYIGCVALFIAASRLPRWGIVSLIRAVIVVSGLIGLQAINQSTLNVGSMPVDVVGVGSTLGNPNFLAAYSGLALPLAVYGAVAASWSTAWRGVAATSAVVGVTAIVLAGSAQGVLVAAVALTALGLAAASLRSSGAALRSVFGAVALTAVVGSGLAAAGAAGSGPLRALSSDTGIQHRLYYWNAAGGMFADNPIRGVGPGHFAYEYRTYRPLEDALTSAVSENTDSAHSVPLQMFAEGGLLWGIPYLVFLIAVTAAAWRAVAFTSSRERLLAAAVAGAWVGYVAQSLVSIDTVALAVLGWVLAGTLVALAPIPARRVEIPLPWRARSKRAAPPLGARVSQVVVVILATIAVWAASIPLRADMAADDPEALETAAGGEGIRDRSTELAGWEPEYWLRLVAPLTEQGQFDAAREVANKAVGVAPRDLEAVMTSARLEKALENPERARELYEQALAIEPVQVDIAMEAAQFAVDSGDPDWARTLLDQVLSHRPDHEAARALHNELGGTASG